jgi:hypothetical protein
MKRFVRFNLSGLCIAVLAASVVVSSCSVAIGTTNFHNQSSLIVEVILMDETGAKMESIFLDPGDSKSIVREFDSWTWEPFGQVLATPETTSYVLNIIDVVFTDP